MKRTKEYFSKTGNFLPPSEGPSLHTLSFYCILDPLSILPQFICKIHLFLQHFLPLFSLILCCCILHTWFGTFREKRFSKILSNFTTKFLLANFRVHGKSRNLRFVAYACAGPTAPSLSIVVNFFMDN